MTFIIVLTLFFLGLCLGSFVNMLVFRTAMKYGFRKKSTILKSQRSRCDHCQRELSLSENIPVLSWLMQGGKSRCCKKKLSWEYPVVEMGAGLLMLLFSYRAWGWNFEVSDVLSVIFLIQVVLMMLLVALLLFSMVFDIKYMILPDFSSFTLIGVALLGVVFDESNIIPYLLSALGASAFLGLLHLITKGKGMGLGDVKFAIFMGLFLGYPNILIAFYLAFVSGALWGIILMISGKKGKKSEIPFAPFLIIGTIAAWVFSKEILALVLKLGLQF